MLTLRIKPYLLIATFAIGGLALVTPSPASAADCGCQSACLECPPNACEGHCKCCRTRRPNCVYKALDSVAGGIEKLLGLDQLKCGSCEETVCDDGCDAGTLQEFSGSGTPLYLHESQRPGTELEFEQPFVPEPYIPRPGSGEVLPMHEPEFPSQIQQPEPLTNPFLDDANVTKKRQVRATNYERSKSQQTDGKPRNQEQESNQLQRNYSRSYTPTKRLVRTVR